MLNTSKATIRERAVLFAALTDYMALADFDTPELPGRETAAKMLEDAGFDLETVYEAAEKSRGDRMTMQANVVLGTLAAGVSLSPADRLELARMITADTGC